MRKLSTILSLVVLSGCAHYSPVSIGQGKATDKTLRTCTDLILGFPADAENMKLGAILKKNNLTSEDVASVDVSYWMYLWPLYGKTCTLVALSEKGLGKVPAIMKKAEQEKKKTIDENFSDFKTLKGCDTLLPLDKSACRKAVYSRRRATSNPAQSVFQ